MSSEIKTKLVDVSERDEKVIKEVPKPIGHFSADSKDLPELTSWEVGNDYYIVAKVRQKSIRIPDTWEIENGEKGLTTEDKVGDFDIIRVDALPAEKQPAVEKALPLP